MHHGAYANRWYDPSKCTFQKVAHALLADSMHAMDTRSRNRALRAKREQRETSPSPWLAQTPFGSYLREISASDRTKVEQHTSRSGTKRSGVCASTLQCELVLPTLPQSTPPLFICTVGQPNQAWDSPTSDRGHLSTAENTSFISSVLASTARGHRSPCMEAVGRHKKQSATDASAGVCDGVSSSSSLLRVVRSVLSAPSEDICRNRGKSGLATCMEQKPTTKLTNHQRVNELLRRPAGVSSDAGVCSDVASRTPALAKKFKELKLKKRMLLVGRRCEKAFQLDAECHAGTVDEEGNILTPRTALRRELERKAGDLETAARILDSNNSGSVSVTEFRSGLESMHINWARITGVTTIVALFSLFDTERKGELKSEDIYGDWKMEEPEIFPTTQELWNQWCDHATTSAEQRVDTRRSTRMNTNDIMKCEQRVAKQHEQKQKIKYLFSKGLRSVVSREFLAKDNTTTRRLEGDSRLKRSKKIERVMGDMITLRRDLQTTRQSMEDLIKVPEMEVEVRQKGLDQNQMAMKDFSSEELSFLRGKLRDIRHEGDPPPVDLPSMFQQSRLGVTTEDVEDYCEELPPEETAACL
eukprot:GEMP01008160.1.p1 GENE.GEMP01008160.1~~GEMP01008160.1.p1  ORF type:complete len:586 (+),score=154.45 GEMP01008160.1:59-1816(+)